MVSGLAPGKPRSDVNGRKLDLRQGSDGQKQEGEMPASASATVSSEVATGRRDKWRGDIHASISPLPALRTAVSYSARRWKRAGQAIEEKVDDGRGVERQDLAEDQAADDRDAERTAQLEPVPVPRPAAAAESAAMVVIMMGRKRSRHA